MYIYKHIHTLAGFISNLEMRQKNLTEVKDRWIDVVNRKEEKFKIRDEIRYELMCDMKTT